MSLASIVLPSRSLAVAEELLPADAPVETRPAYFREIGRVPLLTAAAEVELAQAIEAGTAAAGQLAAAASLTPGEVDALEQQVQAGCRARARLVEANLRLVVAVAQKYVNRGLALDDLVQEGNLGLLRAVGRFDHRRGFKFSTYATWWIRQAIGRALMDHGRTIRLPVHMHEALSGLNRAINHLQQNLGREPTAAELGEALELPAEQVRALLTLPGQPLSLEASLGEEHDTQLVDFLEDEQAEAPEAAAERHGLRQTRREALREALAVLTERERRALELRHGLDGRGERTLAEVGAALEISRERARQLETSALRKLRQPSLTWPLRAACG